MRSKRKFIDCAPFGEHWILGPYYDKTNNRMRIHVYVKNKSTYMPYARYLMCIKEKRILLSNEDVHHIDHDQTNDDISNLEILNEKIHTSLHKLKGPVKTICTYCKKEYIETRSHYSGRLAKKSEPFCSISCINVVKNARMFALKIKGGMKLKAKIIPIKP